MVAAAFRRLVVLSVVVGVELREQLVAEEVATSRSLDLHSNSFAEALTYFPNPEDFVLGPDEYLDKVNELKSAVRIPIVAKTSFSASGIPATGC